MPHLPYDLPFVHRFNLYEWLGFSIEEDDLESIARVYGADVQELRRVEASFRSHVAALAASLPPLEVRKPPVSLTLLALGDSITSDRESWVRILRSYWGRVPGRRIIDSSVSGHTTTHVIDRFYATVLNHDFDWAVLFLGTNDCRGLNDSSRISFVSLREYRRNMQYFVDRLQRAHRKVAVVTIPPVDNERFTAFFPDMNALYDEQRIRETNDFLRSLCAQQGTTLVDLAAAIAAQEQEVLREDGIHLNGVGQSILARLLTEVLP